jgi:hypothetical protein
MSAQQGKWGFAMQETAATVGGLLGAVLGFYGGIYCRVAFMYLTQRDYDPGMDYAAALFGIPGAVIAGTVGAWIGFSLAGR